MGGLMDKINTLVGNFVRERGIDPTDQSWSKGMCDIISADLTKYLRNEGIEAETIGMTGFKKALPEDAHPDWLNFVGKDPDNNQYLWHSTVKTPDAIIDLTGSQYGKEFSGIRVLPYNIIKQEWKSFKTHPSQEERMKGVLPKDIKLSLAGAGLMGAASLYSPEAAQARQSQDMASQQALQEPTFDPTTLLAGPARWGGGLMNMGADALMKLLGGK